MLLLWKSQCKYIARSHFQFFRHISRSGSARSYSSSAFDWLRNCHCIFYSSGSISHSDWAQGLISAQLLAPVVFLLVAILIGVNCPELLNLEPEKASAPPPSGCWGCRRWHWVLLAALPMLHTKSQSSKERGSPRPWVRQYKLALGTRCFPGFESDETPQWPGYIPWSPFRSSWDLVIHTF